MTVPEITADEAEVLLLAGDATFVDVRDSGSFAQGHVPGAQHVGDHNIAAFVGTADKTRTVVVYCFHGYTSLGGAAYLAGEGFVDARSMTGGFVGWHGKPEEAGANSAAAASGPSATPPLAAAPRPASPSGRAAGDPRPRRRDRLKRRLSALLGR